MSYQTITTIGLGFLALSVIVSLLFSIFTAYGMNSDDHEKPGKGGSHGPVR